MWEVAAKQACTAIFFLIPKYVTSDKPIAVEGKQKKKNTTQGKFGKGYSSFFGGGGGWQNCVGACTASEEPQSSKEAMTRMQQVMQIKESSWEEVAPTRRRQPRGEDRTEMKKEARMVRCTLLNGSAWRTERKNRKYKGTFDIFFGLEHRMKKEEMEEYSRKQKED